MKKLEIIDLIKHIKSNIYALLVSSNIPIQRKEYPQIYEIVSHLVIEPKT